MKKVKQEISYNVYYLDCDGELIDQTQIDKNSKVLAWQLFKEFGHSRKRGYTVELIPTNAA